MGSSISSVCACKDSLKHCSLCYQFIKGDLQSGDLLGYILETEEIDTIMHYAAQVRSHPCSHLPSSSHFFPFRWHLFSTSPSEYNHTFACFWNHPLACPFVVQTHVDNSFGNSLAFTMNNTYGTHVLLEAARMAMPQIRRLINVSTDEVYGESSLGKDTGVGKLGLQLLVCACTHVCFRKINHFYTQVLDISRARVDEDALA